jgi:hypothetical protein
MKKILFIILLAAASLAFAATEFKLHFIEEGNDTIVAFTETDWEYIAQEDPYQLFLNKGGFNKIENGMLKMHSMIVFDKAREYTNISVPVKKIYSYGLVDCENAKLYLITDFFTDANDKIVWVQRHAMGSFITNLDVPNTPRGQVFIKMCGKEAI